MGVVVEVGVGEEGLFGKLKSKSEFWEVGADKFRKTAVEVGVSQFSRTVVEVGVDKFSEAKVVKPWQKKSKISKQFFGVPNPKRGNLPAARDEDPGSVCAFVDYIVAFRDN